MPVDDGISDVAAAADALQAQRLRQCLTEERGDVAARLASHAKTLNDCMESGEMRTVSHHRGHIRQLEDEIHAINRMLDALDERFP